jgi:hypothetical protein
MKPMKRISVIETGKINSVFVIQYKDLYGAGMTEKIAKGKNIASNAAHKLNFTWESSRTLCKTKYRPKTRSNISKNGMILVELKPNIKRSENILPDQS